MNHMEVKYKIIVIYSHYIYISTHIKKKKIAYIYLIMHLPLNIQCVKTK